MGEKIILFVVIAWAVWYLTRDDDPKDTSNEDNTMKNMKKVMKRNRKPIKLKLDFKKSKK